MKTNGTTPAATTGATHAEEYHISLSADQAEKWLACRWSSIHAWCAMHHDACAIWLMVDCDDSLWNQVHNGRTSLLLRRWPLERWWLIHNGWWWTRRRTYNNQWYVLIMESFSRRLIGPQLTRFWWHLSKLPLQAQRYAYYCGQQPTSQRTHQLVIQRQWWMVLHIGDARPMGLWYIWCTCYIYINYHGLLSYNGLLSRSYVKSRAGLYHRF